MNHKMIDAFREANGGLFSSADKADVGDAYEKLKNEGVDLMGWADPFMPDLSMPEFIKKALIEAIEDESSPHYTAPIGNSELKIEIAKKLKSFNHLEVDPLRNIIITPGSDSGLYFAILPFINDGDEVIIPSPSYPNNYLNIRIMGGKVIDYLLDETKGYQIEETELEKLVTPKTKMIILTHPNNPTTTVYNRKSLEALRNVVIRHDLVLVVDQAFEDYTYENEMITPASMDGMFDRTVTVFSVSKGMGLSGLRVGYIVANDVIMDKMYANAVGVIGATSTSSQKAIIEAFRHPEFMNVFKEAYEYRRHKAYEILNSIPNVSCELPESGFLCWVNVSKLGNSGDITNYLVREARVSINDGAFYGPGGEGHLRIVLGVFKDNEKVVKALLRIKDALIRYQNQ